MCGSTVIGGEACKRIFVCKKFPIEKICELFKRYKENIQVKVIDLEMQLVDYIILVYNKVIGCLKYASVIKERYLLAA
jgi:hypothetical protein